MVSVKLPDHSHCKYCGDPIPFGEDYCNETCRKAHADQESRDKLKDSMFYISAIVVVAAIVVARLVL